MGDGGWHTVQPDSNLLIRIRVLRREEPKVQLGGFVGLVADGEKTGVGLANVEVDVWDCAGCAVDREGCCYISFLSPNTRYDVI
jgi:hypothetical protein